MVINMGKWNNNFYIISKDEFTNETLTKIQTFAERVCNETYDRFSYEYERRVEVIKIGKLAEEVFAKFLLDEYGIKVDINYDIYEGIDNVDEDDFLINGFMIDIKSSKDTKNMGLMKCYESFNFPVPSDQEIKDLTVSIIYSYDLKYFVISSAIFKNDYIKMRHFGRLNVGNGVYKTFNLCKLTNGISIKEAMDIVINS